jgi:hypothetical protein
MEWRQWAPNTWATKCPPFGFCVGRYGDGFWRISVARRLDPAKQDTETWTLADTFPTLKEAQEAVDRLTHSLGLR